MKYAAVIAAAGLSAESHGLKPMMCLDEEPIISKIIEFNKIITELKLGATA